MTRILVVDDEKNIVELAKLYLRQEGYDVITAADGAAALEQCRAERPDLVVLDIMLPQIDGWEVCRRLRQAGRIPIIMLTARSDDVDKIVGLELGADDYMVKPFNPRELVARVKAVLRRSEGTLGQPAALNLGNLRIDTARREVWVADQSVSLRAKEFDLLAYLARHRGLVLSRDQLLNAVWGYDFYGDTRTVDVHVAHLRDKLSGSDVTIETVWGIGYKLVGPG
jgi:two-component system alkaline phosphatase synthesis response regulator PhoP/two-component system response regulator ResD